MCLFVFFYRRLAMRVRDLKRLPHGLSTTPSIKALISLYEQSFWRIRYFLSLFLFFSFSFALSFSPPCLRALPSVSLLSLLPSPFSPSSPFYTLMSLSHFLENFQTLNLLPKSKVLPNYFVILNLDTTTYNRWWQQVFRLVTCTPNWKYN